MWLCRAQTIIHRMRKNNGHETSNNISFTLVKVRKKRENLGKYCKASECYFLLRSVSLDISCFLSNRDSLIPFPSPCQKAFHSSKQIFYTKDTKKVQRKMPSVFPKKWTATQKGQTFFHENAPFRLRH